MPAEYGVEVGRHRHEEQPDQRGGDPGHRDEERCPLAPSWLLPLTAARYLDHWSRPVFFEKILMLAIVLLELMA
jgi:hypothetical protein